MASTEQDSATDLSSAGTKQEMEVEPMVPRIICEAKKEEEMTTNVRVSFKERQNKHLSESITFAPPPTKKSCPKVPRLTPISDIPSVLNPSTDVEGPNCASTARPPIGKYAHPERGGASNGPIPPSDDPVKCVASATWEFEIEFYLIALARNQLTVKKVDLSILGEIAHHLMICRGNDFHAVKPYASHDDVEKGINPLLLRTTHSG